MMPERLRKKSIEPDLQPQMPTRQEQKPDQRDVVDLQDAQ
jgi:hypothetical protein